MPCSYCGCATERVSFYCRECYRPTWGDDLDPVEHDERFVALAEACEAIVSQTWTLAQFSAYLDTFEADQRRRAQLIHAVDIPCGLEQDLAEELEVGYSGLDVCDRAIEVLRAYDPEEPSVDGLLEGLRLFHRGVNHIKEAMQINRANVARPTWV